MSRDPAVVEGSRLCQRNRKLQLLFFAGRQQRGFSESDQAAGRLSQLSLRLGKVQLHHFPARGLPFVFYPDAETNRFPFRLFQGG